MGENHPRVLSLEGLGLAQELFEQCRDHGFESPFVLRGSCPGQ